MQVKHNDIKCEFKHCFNPIVTSDMPFTTRIFKLKLFKYILFISYVVILSVGILTTVPLMIFKIMEKEN